MQHLVDACYARIAHEAQSTSHAADRETLSQELENAKKGTNMQIDTKNRKGVSRKIFLINK